jgi:excisionase family DNA binding protein
MTEKSTAIQPIDSGGATGHQWLTLSEASEFLGVHFTTLRSWADKGEIRVFRTPGGHRRFSIEDLRRFLEHRAGYAATPNVNGLVEAAVGRVRQEIDRIAQAEKQWRYALNEEATAVRRQRGRELFALAISYVLKPRRRAKILENGRRLGQEYGREAARNGVGLVETGRAVQFFRSQLGHAVHHEETADTPDADDMRIQHLINEFLDEVLYAVLDGYERTLLEMHGAARPG